MPIFLAIVSSFCAPSQSHRLFKPHDILVAISHRFNGIRLNTYAYSQKKCELKKGTLRERYIGNKKQQQLSAEAAVYVCR